jgi:hypothetical protein
MRVENKGHGCLQPCLFPTTLSFETVSFLIYSSPILPKLFTTMP